MVVVVFVYEYKPWLRLPTTFTSAYAPVLDCKKNDRIGWAMIRPSANKTTSNLLVII